MASQPRKSERLGLRLTVAQRKHLSDLQQVTHQTISTLVNRALELLTLDLIPEWIPAGAESLTVLPDDIWQELVLETLTLIGQATKLHHRIITEHAEQGRINKRALYRDVQAASRLLSQLTRTLTTLRNGNGGHAS